MPSELEGSGAGVEGGSRGREERGRQTVRRNQDMQGLAGPVRTLALTLGEMQNDW